MPVIRLQNFGGSIPIIGDRALPDGAAAEAFNTWLYGKELRGVRPPADPANGAVSVGPTTAFVYRIPRATVGGDPAYPGVVPPPSYTGDSFWMEFADADTSVVRSPLVNDAHKRYYWASPSTGPYYNTKARILGGNPPFKLGVNRPAVAPALIVTGGVAPTNVTRAYVVTWQTTYGEESAPSPPVIVAGKADGSWDLSAIPQPAPADVLNRAPITDVNIYRTITAASGVTTYFRVATVALGVLTYSDTLSDTVVAGNLQLTSTNYDLPPANLSGLIAMPNGFLIGWVGADLYMSEPYQPHAWPTEYITAVDYPVVGLAVFGQTCAVLTEGFPAAISGVKPVAMSLTKSQSNEPCMSRRSIVATANGVYYAGANGLVAITAGGVANLTAQIISREQWQQEFTPQFIRAASHDNGYLALRITPDIGSAGMFFLDPTALSVAVTEFSIVGAPVMLQNDVWSGKAIILNAAPIVSVSVQFWDSTPAALWPARWKSKEFQLPVDTNFGCYSVYWDESRFYSSSVESGMIGANERVRLRVWCNRVLKYDQAVPRNGDAVRLPSGFKGDIWQFELRCRAPVYSLHIATTMKELRNA